MWSSATYVAKRFCLKHAFFLRLDTYNNYSELLFKIYLHLDIPGLQLAPKRQALHFFWTCALAR